MFWRILWRLLYASRSRLALALLAVASGAAVCAALVNLDLDAGDKLTREFRTLGANVVVSPQSERRRLSDDGFERDVEDCRACNVAGACCCGAVLVRRRASGRAAAMPFRVIVAGTWLDQVARMDSWWKVDGQWINSPR